MRSELTHQKKQELLQGFQDFLSHSVSLALGAPTIILMKRSGFLPASGRLYRSDADDSLYNTHTSPTYQSEMELDKKINKGVHVPEATGRHKTSPSWRTCARHIGCPVGPCKHAQA